MGLHFAEGVAGALVDARLADQAGAGQPLGVGDHVRADAVTERLAGLARVVRNVLVLLLVYVAHILEAEVAVHCRLLVRLQVGNALDGQHHVGEQLVELSVLVLGGERGGLGRRWGAGGGVGVGVLLVS